jgi:hypothetical protein
LKVLDTPGLTIWKLKTIAEQFSLRPDLVMLAGDEATRYEAVKQALNSSNQKSNIGTSIHRYTELFDMGQLDWNLLPAPCRPWLEHYMEARDSVGWKVVETECSIYNHTAGYAGTADRFLEIDGEVFIVDLKTGKDVYADMALQLCMYTNGEGIFEPPEATPESDALLAELEQNIANGTNIPEGRRKWSEDAVKVAKVEINEVHWREYARLGTHRPMPTNLNRDKGVIIHLTEDGCKLVPLDLTDCYEVVYGLAKTHAWKSRKDIILPAFYQSGQSTPRQAVEELKALDAALSSAVPDQASDGVEPVEAALRTPQEPVTVTLDELRSRAGRLSAEARQELVWNWPEGVPTFKQGGHQPEQLDHLSAVLFEIETKHSHAPHPVLEITEAEAMETVLSAFPGATLDAA